MKRALSFWAKCLTSRLTHDDLLNPSLLEPHKLSSKSEDTIRRINSTFSLQKAIFLEGIGFYIMGFLTLLISAPSEVYIGKFYKQLLRALAKSGEETPYSLYYECTLTVLCLVAIRSIFSPLGLYFFAQSKCQKSALLQNMAVNKLLHMNMKSQSDTGQLINCISIDIETTLKFYESSHDLLIMPYKFFFLARVIVTDLGNAGSFGLLGVLVCMGSAWLMENSLATVMSRTSKVNDKRANFFHQFISGVKTIKANRLESYLEEKTAAYSGIKLGLLKVETTMMTIIESVTRLTPLTVSLLVLVYYFNFSVPSKGINEILFTAISSFSISIGIFLSFSMALHDFYCNNIAVNRIFHAFFTKKTELLGVKEIGGLKNTDGEIKIQQGHFTWEEVPKRDQEKGTQGNGEVLKGHLLRDVQLDVKNNEFVIITGKMGAGKSSLVNVLLGQMPYSSGTRISVDSSIAYVPQEPFLITNSIRANITLGDKPIDMGRYHEAILAASLVKDLHSFPNGDMTQILPGALNISGGQRHRISVARAFYHSKNILLVDDVLTSLDVKTGKEIFRALYQRSKKQTVVLIMQILPKHIPKGTKLYEISNNSLKPVEISGKHLGDEKDFEAHAGGVVNGSIKAVSKGGENGHQREYLLSSQNAAIFEILRSYILRISPWYSLIWVALFIPCQFLSITIEKKFQEFNEEEFNSDGLLSYFGHRVCLIIVYICCLIVRNIYNCYFFFKLASSLCNQFLPGCFRAPYTFFSDKHKREIESLFTKELEELERHTHSHVKDLFHQIFRYIGSFSVVCLSVPRFTLPLLIFLMVHFYFLFSSSKSTTNIMALEAAHKAKALSLVEQCTEGSTLFRIMEKTGFIKRKFQKTANNQITVSFNRYLCEIISIQLGFISSGLCGVLMLSLSFFGAKTGVVSLAIVTSSLTYSYTVSSSISSISKRVIGAQRSLSCVFNIQNKIKVIPEENYSQGTQLARSDAWPKTGSLDIEGFCLKYETQLTPVVRGLNFSIKHGEKISVVGRTGSGKSSLLSGLIRLLEPYEEPNQTSKMSLLIGGKDIRSVQLADLRDRLGYVSQEVIIFEGTIRENIDPYGRYSEDAVGQIVKQTIGIMRPDITPDFEIVEGGKNLSSGEKQMICFARVLIKKPSLVLADEATSSIDEETEKVFNENLAHLFSNCTVLAITHKPESLVYYDKALIFGAGKIMKEVKTEELLANLDAYSQFIL